MFNFKINLDTFKLDQQLLISINKFEVFDNTVKNKRKHMLEYKGKEFIIEINN